MSTTSFFGLKASGMACDGGMVEGGQLIGQLIVVVVGRMAKWQVGNRYKISSSPSPSIT